ncbi:NAD(P)/FAD-dependent oxidoreductase [Fusobacterium sp. PH5-44]|uniref:NAD(P)/FAD-dependent oxidoreductase n=1 Tax=unclassified Fusobacterium TaxID=2648384 RepID=UPI003D1AA1DB
MDNKNVIIVGGGPAGLAVAVKLYKKGIKNILLIEREKTLGGILRQCIHDGFGLVKFGEQLSGPEYAQRFIDEVNNLGIEYVVDSTVIDISSEKVVTYTNKNGLHKVQGDAIVLTMGCRERTRGALSIPGERPTGVYTAGVAQSYMNIYNTMVGKNVIILGSGDIGLIMARRMTLEGANVMGVFEIKSYPSGLPRNIIQCLDDYNIPLYLSHTVTNIHGNGRLKGVTISEVDDKFDSIEGTEKYYECDTLILSVGLIPENELSQKMGVILDKRTNGAIVDENYQTNISGVFAAGNVLHVHDLVDFVTMEGEKVADSIRKYLEKCNGTVCNIAITTDRNINHTIPQNISGNEDFLLSFRGKNYLKNVVLTIKQGDHIVEEIKMKKLNPAEMVQIPIKKDKLIKECDLEVLVNC